MGDEDAHCQWSWTRWWRDGKGGRAHGDGERLARRRGDEKSGGVCSRGGSGAGESEKDAEGEEGWDVEEGFEVCGLS